MIDTCVEKVGDIWFGVAFDGECIYATTFASSEANALQGLRESVHLPFSPKFRKETKFAQSVVKVLKDIYDGKEVSHNFSLATGHLSKYARKAIEIVCKVPVGYITSYGEVAKAIGGGPRAVGQIMARNPFAPICPCHRVVRSDFTLGGYGGGLDVKLAFLKRERRSYPSECEISVNNRKLQLFPVELAIRKVEEG